MTKGSDPNVAMTKGSDPSVRLEDAFQEAAEALEDAADKARDAGQ